MCSNSTALPPRVASKNGTLKTCSRNSAPTAADSATVATMFISAVANVAHVKSGMRVHVIPGARIFMIVTMKFSPVIVELIPITKIAMHHSAPAVPSANEMGGYSVHPACGPPNSIELKRMSAATGRIQKLSMFSHGNATSRAPIWSGMTKFPIAPVTSGIRTIHTIAVPCMVNISLYAVWLMIAPSGFVS